ncbi:hypothetical protein O181_111711 [Austropuccinia psidii MF-1]|uniref:Reverse transcriptase Ty1/copia-type domain-containing protein n=1 Tax=Austropuccinia psidii MF-1 TaxID=1389203 RepID=A0A9Q3K0Z5_9BASI|nr:hypothetical protein [Austropuccinia psidii MF-1]
MGEFMSSPHHQHWREACIEELSQMERGDVWKVVDKKHNMKTIGNLLVFDVKHDNDSSIEKFKARLLARSDHQCPGIDCTKIYEPTVSLISLFLILVTACLKQCAVSPFDASGAYPYSLVEETILMEPPTSKGKCFG